MDKTPVGKKLSELSPEKKGKIMPTFQSVKKRNPHLSNDQVLEIVADILTKGV